MAKTEPIEITSTKNKTVSEIKKLKQKKYREQSGMFLAEGYRNVCDSMQKQAPVMIFQEESATDFPPIPEETAVYRVTGEVLKELCDTVTPQGVLGVFRIPEERDINGNRVLLLNGVSDPGNLGTILRTALAAGFYHIVLDEQCADVYSPKVIRSAMSAVFSLNLIRVKHLEDTVKRMQTKGYRVYAAALTESAKSVYSTDFSEKTALMFGSEASGICEELLAIANETYIIPMQEEIESLNVAVAAGISMYEVVRRTNTIR